jgi:membrane protein YqaA with SNARE-associated domain
MNIFSKIYLCVLNWAESKYAIYWLSVISFLESFILPYPPPDLILAPMAFKRPKRAYFFALVCTLTSVLGGVFGYFIGIYAYELLLPFLQKMDYLQALEKAKEWFYVYDIWIIAIAGFSPVPYKIFTISAGILLMPLLPFILISLLARGLRYYLICFLVKKFGKSADVWLQKHIDTLGYVLIIIFILVIYVS